MVNQLEESGKNLLQSFKFDDEFSFQDEGAIEVTVTLKSGERRWCFFLTPNALSRCGDWIDGTQTLFHYGAKHMIVVVGRLDETIIEQALKTIDQRGELIECTIPL